MPNRYTYPVRNPNQDGDSHAHHYAYVFGYLHGNEYAHRHPAAHFDALFYTYCNAYRNGAADFYADRDFNAKPLPAAARNRMGFWLSRIRYRLGLVFRVLRG